MFAVTPQEAQTSHTAVTGILMIQSTPTHVLFDSGATHLFVSPSFALKLGKDREPMHEPLSVATPTGETMMITHRYPSCTVEIEGRQLVADLMELSVLEFDVILGMDWLSRHRAVIDCYARVIMFRPDSQDEFMYQGDRSKAPITIISAIEARRFLRKGCQGYLVYVHDTSTEIGDLQ